MALDGCMIAALRKELSETLTGGHISKITMPEKDELLFQIKNNGTSCRLLISAGASLPLIYLTDTNKPSPMQAPAFCMLLRKHLGSAGIVSVTQCGLERVLCIEFECLDELDDPCRRRLYVELMGKYSNIIFTDDNNMIIDSIKRIPSSVSSLREVLPRREYYLPEELRKHNPLTYDLHNDPEGLLLAANTPMASGLFFSAPNHGRSRRSPAKTTAPAESSLITTGSAAPTEDSLLTTDSTGPADASLIITDSAAPETDGMPDLTAAFEGISPLMADELYCRAAHRRRTDTELTLKAALVQELESLRTRIQAGAFSPVLITRAGEPKDFSAFRLMLYEDTEYTQTEAASVSSLLEEFYSAKEERTRIRQKSADLRRIIISSLEKASKKLSLQQKQLRDCAGKDKFKVYGDLLHTYGYELKGGEKEFSCLNYYDENKEIRIPLDEHKNAQENAKRYFDRYQKLRRTELALKEETQKTENDIEHLASLLQSIEISMTEADLNQIRQELSEYGYVRRSVRNNSVNSRSSAGSGKALRAAATGRKAAPLHFVSSDGFDIYVGKNNYQNEEVTFGIGSADDWWFHAKGAPGSHVIVKCPPSAAPEDLPDRLFEEAASLAAYYSSHTGNEKVEIDYTRRKNLKRTPGGPPGFVIYHTNYSMMAEPKLLKQKADFSQ